MHYIDLLLHFFIDNFPTYQLICWLFPLSLIWSFLVLYIAGFCKINLRWKTGYTRKLFHFFIFISAFLFQKYIGLPGVFILGWAVTIVLLYTCFKGNKNLFYEALAREKDEPHRTKYIVYSYLSTFFGGVFSNLLFGPFAVLGYAVTGIADAIAEPVGTRFGKHQYRVFSFDKNKVSHRSIEGSISVFITTFIVVFCIFFLNEAPPSLISIPFFLLVAAVCTFAEALSPSGFDNLVLQLTVSGLFYYLMK